MARRPFFSGNYGSALGSTANAANLIARAGEQQGQMFANLGKQVSGAIEQYGLNKEKRAKLTGEIEAYYKENPNAISEIGMSGDEAQDKKDFLQRDKFVKGDMSMADLEGYAGKLARGEVLKKDQLVRDLSEAQLQSAQFLNQEREKSATNLNNAFDALDSTRNEIQGLIDRGELNLENLTLGARRLINNPAKLKSRRPEDLKFFASDPVENLQTEQIEANIARTRGLTEATKTQMNLLSRVDPAIPQNEDISKLLKDLRSNISALRKQKSFTKNDDGEFLSLEDLVEFDDITGKATISENASRRDQIALKELVKLVESEHSASLDQILTHTFKNGQIVKAPMRDIIKLIKEEEDDELRKKAEANQKLRNLRNTQGVMRMDYDYSNLDPSIAEMMAGPK